MSRRSKTSQAGLLLVDRQVDSHEITGSDEGEIICGVDEAGRGPLAGSVFAAAVILDPETSIEGLRDSKKLSEKQRTALAVEIQKKAVAWAVTEATVEEIDELNILQATMLAMQRAVSHLKVKPTLALIDGKHCPKLSVSAEAITGGDSRVPAISAASILAKTARDESLRLLHAQYPQYEFHRHKGYPTALHLEKLRIHGVSPVHRKTYRPVKALLNTMQEAYTDEMDYLKRKPAVSCVAANGFERECEA